MLNLKSSKVLNFSPQSWTKGKQETEIIMKCIVKKSCIIFGAFHGIHTIFASLKCLQPLAVVSMDCVYLTFFTVTTWCCYFLGGSVMLGAEKCQLKKSPVHVENW